ncbi:3-hydroxyacyl-CoA dehydrogenase family protein [Schlegelella sp. S2-27]|uniref:3-hydroxyacyl-CoA dehydrogenase family protein n=1 Tax=Caldimonas mangrovi TaxID=2944811 RepID=A0ABT0YVF3_9BURK|nr:3-hydroxyacyl-CoA dehydrogenase family protein [Caldimonas mangrovi]MCM5682731.1 3-hydroxyacyl-CoA dehydrogenase family protein [Caldimonas mangrovi]
MEVAVAGAGLMGCGIATRLAASGLAVTLYDSHAGSLDKAASRCAEVFEELVDGGAMTEGAASVALGRIALTPRLTGLQQATMVIEAVVEVLDVKHRLYALLEDTLAPHAVIASSTSGFTPDSLAGGMRHPERFLVAHFWNPPHLIPLVEVLACRQTRPSAVASTVSLLAQAGCEPVVLHKAVPGFIGNRFQFAVLREALHMLREGVADAATIDQVMKHSVGRRYRHLGPLEGADLGGLDTFLSIARHLMPQLAKSEDVLALLDEHVRHGRTGRASGEGFYTWNDEKLVWLRQVRLAMLRQR